MKKIGEIERLTHLVEKEGISYEELAELSETSVRTITNTIYDNKPIGHKLLRGLHKKGVSLDWLLSGEGEMYRDESQLDYKKYVQPKETDDSLARMIRALYGFFDPEYQKLFAPLLEEMERRERAQHQK